MSHWLSSALVGVGVSICVGALGLNAHALEGNLPKDKASELTALTYGENCAGSWQIRDIVRDFNKWDKVKIGIDQRLVQGGKTVTDFKVDGLNPIACCEALAKKLNSRLFVVRDWLYIAPELPPGMANAGGAAPQKPEPEKPKGDTPPPPAPPAVGNGGKPPSGNGNKGPGQKPPPAQGAPKPPVEKTLAPLKPMTPGMGLSELLAVFPGTRPGTSHVISWSHKTMAACVNDGIPIVLLTYYSPADPKLMTPDETKTQARLDKDCKDAAEFFETLILEDPEVVTELKGKVNFILIPSTEPAESWPAAYTDPAKKEGGVLFLLPKTGAAPILTWDSRNPQCCAQALIRAAKALLPAAPKAVVPPKADAAQVARKPDEPNGPPNGANAPRNADKPKSDKVKDE